MRWRGLFIAALAWCSVAGAPAVGQAPDSSLEAKVRDVAATLRCPVCQNLSIQDSPSQLAQDMKRLVRERLAAGETPAEVRRYFVSRYGEWVLLKPKASGIDLSVWALPLLALLGGGVVVWRAVRRWVRQGGAMAAPAISPATPQEELRSQRAALQASLQDLQAEFAAGRLAASDLELLTQRDEARFTAVNIALKELQKPGAAPEPRERGKSAGVASSMRRWPPAATWSAGLVLFAGAVALSLKGALVSRPTGGTITGSQLGGATAEDAAPSPSQDAGPLDSLRLTQLEAHVRRDSTDQAALIELGHLYLTQGLLRKAADVSVKAVQLQPDAANTAEAFAHLGMILWSAGQTDAALKSLDKALFLHPDLPEALLYRGIILFAGVRDMRAAAQTLERYLEVAPSDANTGRVKGMLQAARQASSGP